MKNLVKSFVVVAGLTAALYSCEPKQNAANEATTPADSVATQVETPQPAGTSAAATEDTSKAQ